MTTKEATELVKVLDVIGNALEKIREAGKEQIEIIRKLTRIIEMERDEKIQSEINKLEKRSVKDDKKRSN